MGLNKRIILSINPVDPSDHSLQNGYSIDVLEKFDGIFKKAFSMGFDIMPWARGCSTVSKGIIAIGPNGDIYKCPAFVGRSLKTIGNINDGFYNKFTNNRVEKLSKKCRLCKYLPICHGGCLAIKENLGEEFCFYDANHIILNSYATNKYNFTKKEIDYNRLIKHYK